jgi:hypothetical protein
VHFLFLRLLRLFAAGNSSDAVRREKAQKTQKKAFAPCNSLRLGGFA